jgi:predicted ATPase/DNA-binding CsgD family transcriptional regulator
LPDNEKLAALAHSTDLPILENRERSAERTGAPPVPATPLFGRDETLAELSRLLTTKRTRLLTLTGPGGTGKSRLALELAAELRATFPTIWFVDLTTVRDPDLVPSAIAQAVGARDGGSGPRTTALHDFLAAQPSLIILDNFEHVMDAASFVGDLLQACLELVVLVTSREGLGLRAERVFLVEPLAVPDLEQLSDAEFTRLVPSVVLFEERARARRATFQLTDDVVPVVGQICVRLDGLPLAIELAAAQANVLTPAAILKRLNARAPLIGSVHRDLPARHQTLQSTVAWSYDLLEPAEQAVFRQCGVFSGGFSAEAIEAVCVDLPTGGVPLAIVAQLVTKSLVRMADELAEEPRFWLLETIREYAVDQLQCADELATARRRHAEYFVGLAERREGSLLGPRTATVLDHLAREYANFRAVFQWASEAGELAQGLRLADALYRFWIARGPLSEPRAWLEHALAKSGEESAPLRAGALNAAGVLAAMQQDHDRAMQLLRESLDLWVGLGETSRQATVLLNIGLLAHITGQAADAQHQLERSHALFLEVGDRSGQARAVASQARLAREQGDLARAMRLAEEALVHFRLVGDDFGTAHQLANLGHLKLALDDHSGAAAGFRQALEAWQVLGNPFEIAECLDGVAAVLTGQPRRAAQLLGAAEALRERSGALVAAVEKERYGRLVARVQRQLRDDTFAAAWRDGRALTMDRAIELARVLDQHVASHQGDDGVLSPREREIAQLIGRGQSNRGIAESLIVSIKTVETHVQHIFRKLECTSRSEVAVWASRHGLT